MPTKKQLKMQAPELDETAESPDWFLDHVKYIIPDKTEREHFLNYLAFLIQHPDKKIMHGMLIIGKQGIGKSIMQRVFEKIYGEKNVSAPHNENLSVAFSNHDNALYLDNNDRRWFIVNSPAERKTADYYDALIEHINAGCADVFHYLKNKDISAFRPF